MIAPAAIFRQNSARPYAEMRKQAQTITISG